MAEALVRPGLISLTKLEAPGLRDICAVGLGDGVDDGSPQLIVPSVIPESDAPNSRAAHKGVEMRRVCDPEPVDLESLQATRDRGEVYRLVVPEETSQGQVFGSRKLRDCGFQTGQEARCFDPSYI